MQYCRAGEVETKPFVPYSFNQNEAMLSSMESLEGLRSRNKKRILREIAQREGLVYDKEKIGFAKKIIGAVVDEIKHGN